MKHKLKLKHELMNNDVEQRWQIRIICQCNKKQIRKEQLNRKGIIVLPRENIEHLLQLQNDAQSRCAEQEAS